jgi:hypothetical protein
MDDDDDDLNDDDDLPPAASDNDAMQPGDDSDSDDSTEPDLTSLQRATRQLIPDGVLPRPTRRQSGPTPPSKKMAPQESQKSLPIKVSTNRKSKQQPTTGKAAANSGKKTR